MSFSSNINLRYHKTCTITDDNAYIKTTSNLSTTPADIRRLVAQGIPVSSSNASSFCDGVAGVGALPLAIDERRGVDIVDAWNASRDAQSKLVSAHKADVKQYGD